MGAANLDPPPPPQPLRTPSPFSSTQAATRSSMAPGANVPRKLPDDFVEAAMRELELESESRSVAGSDHVGSSVGGSSSSDKENRIPQHHHNLFSSAGSRASVWKRAEAEEIIGAGEGEEEDDDGLAHLEALRLARRGRRSVSPSLAGLLPMDMATPTTPAYSTRIRNAALEREVATSSGGGGGVYIDNDDNNRTSEQRLVEEKRRYPVTTPGGYAPTHLRQQFCLIDHPHRRREETEAVPPPPPRKETDVSAKTATKTTTATATPEAAAPKKSLFSRLVSFARRIRPKSKSTSTPTPTSTTTPTTTTTPPDQKWWKWEIRATYQRPFSMSPDGSVTPTPSGAHVELSIWTRAATLPLRHAVVWGVPWRQGRAADVGDDMFGEYDGCARHPAGALGRWGRMVERRAYFSDRRGKKGKGGEGDWTARASVVHDDRAWLERVAPEDLVSMEAANTIEIYDTSHELCFLLDANTNQWWVLKEDAISPEQGQWLGDNVWNVVHGFDEGNWVRRSLQYRKKID